jgi:hypothetical protein
MLPPPASYPRTAAAGLFAAWLAYTVVLGLVYAHLPVNPDEAIFDYVGWRLTQGASLYLDVAEQNFPGQMWLHAASTWLFGNHAWSWRTFDYLLLLPFCFVLRAWLRAAGTGALANVVVPLYQAMYVTAGAWMAGTRDLLGAHLLLAGAFAWQQRVRGGGRAWVLAHGAASACAVLIRPTYALFPLLVAAADAIAWWRGRRTLRAVLGDGALAGAACAALLGGVAAIGWSSGQLQEWYQLAVRYNVEVYSHNAGVLDVARALFALGREWHWYFGCGLTGLLLAARDAPSRGLAQNAALVSFAVLLSAFAQLKGFGYHFAGLLPPLALGTAWLLAFAVQRAGASRAAWPRALAIALCALAIGGSLKKQHSQLGGQYAWLFAGASEQQMLAGDDYASVLAVADLVRTTVPKDRSVLVWSRMLHVNFLTERVSPTRFITVWMLNGMPPRFAAGNRWLDEFEHAMATAPPAVVVLDEPREPGSGIDVWADEHPGRAIAALRAHLQRDYEKATTLGNLVVWRMRDR